MKRLIISGIICSLLFLSGCATKVTETIVTEHELTVRNHSTQEVTKVIGQSNAIASGATFECPEGMDPTACALAQVLVKGEASRAIASLETKAYTGKRAKTELDVQSEVAGVIGNGIPMFVVGGVAYKAIDADRGDTKISAKGNVENSFEENHATAMSTDGGTSSPTNQPHQNNSVGESEY